MSPNQGLLEKMDHLKEDVLPNEMCCKGEKTRNRCDQFFGRRGPQPVLQSNIGLPITSTQSMVQPTPTTQPLTMQPTIPPSVIIPILPVIVFVFSIAFFFGDPHISTLDNHPYTFNGKGEFILIETNDNLFTLQGRMIAALNNNDAEASATVFTAIVAKQSDSPAVQFELLTAGDGTVDLVAIVDGIRIDLTVIKSQRFNNVIVSDTGNNTMEASFSSGAFILVREANGFMSLFGVSLPLSFQSYTGGLMGNFNGDPSDDFLPRHGSILVPISASDQEIYEQFGITCKFQEIN